MKLFELIRDVYGDLGMTETFLATGGSTTTVVNNQWQIREDQPDDNYAIDYTVIVNRDAAGAGALPEGQFARVTAYDSTTWTYTIDTITAVASGDEIILCTAEIPLYEMIRACNRGLRELGPLLSVPDTSLTTAASQTEYTLPAAIQKGMLKQVWIQGKTDDANDNEWEEIGDYRVEQGTYGSTGTLIFAQQPRDGRTLKLIYDGIHPALTAYNSEIASSVPEELAIAAATKYALRWYNNNTEGASDFWLQRYNEAALDFDTQRRKLRKIIKTFPGMPQWDNERRYPGDQSIYDRVY